MTSRHVWLVVLFFILDTCVQTIQDVAAWRFAAFLFSFMNSWRSMIFMHTATWAPRLLCRVSVWFAISGVQFLDSVSGQIYKNQPSFCLVKTCVFPWFSWRKETQRKPLIHGLRSSGPDPNPRLWPGLCAEQTERSQWLGRSCCQLWLFFHVFPAEKLMPKWAPKML